jgi:hypothetical protein
MIPGSPQLFNAIEVETRWGYRTFELYQGDILDLPPGLDLLALFATSLPGGAYRGDAMRLCEWMPTWTEPNR